MSKSLIRQARPCSSAPSAADTMIIRAASDAGQDRHTRARAAQAPAYSMLHIRHIRHRSDTAKSLISLTRVGVVGLVGYFSKNEKTLAPRRRASTVPFDGVQKYPTYPTKPLFFNGLSHVGFVRYPTHPTRL